MKITVENGDRKVVREVSSCRTCPFNQSGGYANNKCSLYDISLRSYYGQRVEYKQCSQCKKEIGELE